MTETARERLTALSAREGGALRLSLKKGGCAGMEYAMAMAADPVPGDEIVEAGGARLFVDPAAVLYLIGTVMDWRQQAFSAGFVFENPNVTSACGCGESVSIAPAALPVENGQLTGA